jgi:hypothetical protein
MYKYEVYVVGYIISSKNNIKMVMKENVLRRGPHRYSLELTCVNVEHDVPHCHCLWVNASVLTLDTIMECAHCVTAVTRGSCF